MTTNEPIFQSIFGESWDQLPPVFHKHYSLRPYSEDRVTVTGSLDVMCKPPLLWLAVMMKALGQIPLTNANGVPVKVEFKSESGSRGFQFNRWFQFAKTKSYLFQSRMFQIEGSEVAELMRFGLVWKLKYSWEDGKVILRHRGYAIQLFGRLISIPLSLLIGEGYAEEWALDDNSFFMQTHITHPWWGKIYEYKGKFEVQS